MQTTAIQHHRTCVIRTHKHLSKNHNSNKGNDVTILVVAFLIQQLCNDKSCENKIL